MATQTTNLGLSKAETTDKILDTLLANNNNFEIIDSKYKELLDSIGVKVLEASENNVIDFNTLTEDGIYLIKNCNANTALNNHLASTNTTQFFDVFLFVQKRINVEDGRLLGIYQFGFTSGNSLITKRYYSESSHTWEDWKAQISAASVSTGTFPSGISCNTPTSDAHLANKAYVDSAISSSITTALEASY